MDVVEKSLAAAQLLSAVLFDALISLIRLKSESFMLRFPHSPTGGAWLSYSSTTHPMICGSSSST